MAPWWPSDMTKALQQRWWYSSTTSLDYCWCAMNKPPYYDFKLPCVAYSCSQKTQPHAIFEDFIFLSDIFFSPCLFSTFAVKQWFTEIAWRPFFSKEKEKMVEIEGLEGGGGRERGPKCPWHLRYIFLNWWDGRGYGEEEKKKTLNRKGEKQEKRKTRFPASLVRDVTEGEVACYVMPVSHLFNLLDFTQWLIVKGYLQAKSSFSFVPIWKRMQLLCCFMRPQLL